MTHYIAELAKLNFKIADVREGAERVIHTRENATFPPFAVLLRGCTEARADRMRAERANAMLDDDGAPSQRRDLSPRGIASSLSEFRSLRAEVKEILSERRTNTPVITPEPEEEPWECPF